jgi:hypothetical protein
MVRAPARKRGRTAKCPVCGAAWPAPAATPKAALPAVPVPPPPDEFAGSTPDEEPDSGNPYRTADAGSRRCPGCSAWLAPEVVVCVRCGFDLRSGQKLVKEYQKLDRAWDSGMSLRTRLALFALCQALALLAIGTGFASLEPSSGSAAAFGFSWLVYTTMTAFLLGSFDHVELKRYRSGRVDLVQRLRLGFIPRPARKIDVRAYAGVIHGTAAHAGWWEWLVFFILFLTGLVVPALVYWYCVIFHIEYTVSLTNVHGNPEVYVYRGWKEEQMHEVAQTLRDAMTV